MRTDGKGNFNRNESHCCTPSSPRASCGGYLGLCAQAGCPKWTTAPPQKLPEPSGLALKGPLQFGNLQKLLGTMWKLSELVFLTSWMSNTVKQRLKKVSENVGCLAADFLWAPEVLSALRTTPSVLHSPRATFYNWGCSRLQVPLSHQANFCPCPTLMEPVLARNHAMEEEHSEQFLQEPDTRPFEQCAFGVMAKRWGPTHAHAHQAKNPRVRGLLLVVSKSWRAERRRTPKHRSKSVSLAFQGSLVLYLCVVFSPCE